MPRWDVAASGSQDATMVSNAVSALSALPIVTFVAADNQVSELNLVKFTVETSGGYESNWVPTMINAGYVPQFWTES